MSILAATLAVLCTSTDLSTYFSGCRSQCARSGVAPPINRGQGNR